MPAIPRTVRWTVLADLEATLVLLQQAIDQTEFAAVSRGPGNRNQCAAISPKKTPIYDADRDSDILPRDP